ncbi:MAG: helix-turn-helix domain-containing protein [Deltaproteobacteria bacterium]|nr:helix-turn-helix domain-containing protein [Deltaproteobacteria bacterium]
MTAQQSPSRPRRDPRGRPALPRLLTVPEVADVLRTSPKAVYSLIQRGQLPGVLRLSRRVLVDHDELCTWLETRCATPRVGGQPQ